MSFLDYQRTLKDQERRESAKLPGQKFCEKYNWKLDQHYNILQRPDIITWNGGTMYRTITPITHIWYQNKKNKNHHVWVKFVKKDNEYYFNEISDKYKIVVKDGIATSDSSRNFKTYITPNPNDYKQIREFDTTEEAYRFILDIFNEN